MIILTPNEWSTTEEKSRLIITELHIPIDLKSEKEEG